MRTTNAQLLSDIASSHELGYITDTLAQSFIEIVDRLLKKPQFSIMDYDLREEMKSQALMQLCSSWKVFDASKSSNPFAFFTQCAHGAFLVVYSRELRQKQLQIRETE